MEEKKSKLSFKLIWSIIMFFVYLMIGYFVIFTPLLLSYNFRDNLKENDEFIIVRMVLGVGIFLYALFRGYRVVQYLKN